MLNDIQIQKLNELLQYYFKDSNFENIQEYYNEGYKWRAIQVFSEQGVVSSLDKNFFEALEEALSVGSNLLYYTNKDTLLRLNRLYEKEMRELFYHLEQGDDNNLEERIKAFIEGTDKLRKRDQSRRWQKLLACDAMICLTFLKPDEYYFYRPFVMDTAYKFLNGTKCPNGSAVKKACDFHKLCNDILDYITAQRPNLIDKYHSMLQTDETYYQDKSNHLLIQNILYALQYSGLRLENPVPKSFEVNELEGRLTVHKRDEPVSYEQKPWQYNINEAVKRAKNQIRIGKIGEVLVFQTLKQIYGSSVHYVSETDDSKHYDICYKDNAGHDIYVEVKTCRKSCRLPRIYITQAEVDFSRKMQEYYHLWIVLLDERAKKCDYKVFEGDVTQKALSLEYSRDAERYVLEFDKHCCSIQRNAQSVQGSLQEKRLVKG